MFIIPSKTKTVDAPRKGADFSYNRRIENDYNEILESIADQVEGMLNSFSPEDMDSAIDLAQVLQDYSNSLYDWAGQFVGGLVYNLNVDDERTWRRHAAIMSSKLRYELEHVPIQPLMQEFISDNVGLIQSMPLNAAKKVLEIVEKNLSTGQYRSEGLVDQIMGIGKVTKNRAKLIARTEVARISTGLTKARSESLGLPWYMWKTSHDARVRSAHALMDKVIIAWSDPASPERLNREKKDYGPYHPGCIFNCRCFPQPLVRIDDITFPAKVYTNGVIRMMNKYEFMQMVGEQIPIAA